MNMILARRFESRGTILLAAGLSLALAGCSSSDKATGPPDRPAAGKPAKGAKETPRVAKIELSSTAFKEGQPIPKKHAAEDEGENTSPPLAWSGLPEGTKELALICDDPDAPQDEPWVHWVIYKIPAGAKGLPEGVAKDERPAQPAGAVQGRNSWPDGENLGYGGPLPPKGNPHRYFFQLYALDATMPDRPGMTKKQLLHEMSGHVIGRGELMGTYQR
jgi:Raf kinase inhibitor-like YbhB/YbcL family protein